MCGRFTLFSDYQTLIERFSVDHYFNEKLYNHNYNIAPSQQVMAIINDGKRNRMGFLRWGLIPPWAKDEKIGHKMMNARAETLAEKPSFRQAFKRKRCLIIADSFYEWKRHDGKPKSPFCIKLKNNEPFGMAGIWESWKSSNGEKLHSCSIITTKPNQLMENIHNRMPVIVKREDERIWLDPSIHDPVELNKILAPFDDELMEAFEVSTDVNSPKNNSSNLIQALC